MVNEMRILFLLLVACFQLALVSCTSQTPITQYPILETGTASNEKLSAFEQEINSILVLVKNNELTLASYKLQSIKSMVTTETDSVLLAYAEARFYLAQENIEAAYLTLTEPSLFEKTLQANNHLQTNIGLLKAQVLKLKNKNIDAVKLRIFLAPLIEDQTVYLENHIAIWRLLNALTPDEINRAILDKNEDDFQQWLSLSKIVQHGNLVLDQQITAIDHWQHIYPMHPAALIPPPEIAAIRNATNQLPENIAIILPFDSKYRAIAEAIRDGFMNAYYKTQHQPQLSFYSIDESQSFISIYNEAVEDGADMVIGPLFKNQLEELYQLGTLPVTTIALNKLDQIDKPLNLYEFSLATDDEILSIIELARQENRHNAIVITQEDSRAQKYIDFFSAHWTALGNTVLNTATVTTTREQSKVIQSLLNIEKSNQRIRELQWLIGSNFQYEPRRRQDIDMILMLVNSESATSLRPLLAFHYANDIPIYASSSVYRGYPQPLIDNDLNGIRFTDIPLTLNQRDDVNSKYQTSSLIRMYAFGIDAFQLSERLKLMEGIAEIKLYGATGLLTLTDGKLYRQTSFARFQNGIAKPLPLINFQ